MDLHLKDVLGFESLYDIKEFGKFEFDIAGKRHNMKFMLDYALVTKYGFPAGAITGFNKFLISKDAFLNGFNRHKRALGDWVDPKFCESEHMPIPTFSNFTKLVKFTTVVFSKAGSRTDGGRYDPYGGPEYCAICGEMPWDEEHGVGLIINSAGVVTHMTDFMGAYEHNV